MVPDTLVTMVNGRKYLLRESAQTVSDRIEAYRVRILSRSGDPLYLSADVAGIPKNPDELEE
jgi:uncharacterized protein YlzI (FlbEa/FlbD family)